MSAIVRKIRLGDQYAEKSPQNTVEHKLSIAERSQNTVGYSNEAELKILKDLESELGRMAKLIGQLRARFLSK